MRFGYFWFGRGSGFERGNRLEAFKKLAKKLKHARDDSDAATENEVISIDVLDNDRGGRAKKIFSLNQDDPSERTPRNEWVELDSGARVKIAGGEVVYDTNGAFESLAEGETTTDTFTYTVQVGRGIKSTATVTVEITGQNDAPTVSDVMGTADEDGSTVMIMLAGDDVDSDDDNASLSYEIVSGPSEGTASISGNMLSFDPGAEFQDLAEGETRDVTVTYRATDSHGAESGIATVTITVTGINDAPTVTNVTGSATEDGAAVMIALAGADVDSDDDNASLTYDIVSGPAEGSASISGNMISFDPGADFQDLAEGETRDVSITYEATDVHGATSGTATVTVTVTGVNDIAMITGDTGEVTEDGTLVAGGNVIVTDADAGQSGTIAQANVAGLYGTFSIGTDGAWTYILDNDNADVQALNDGEVLMESFPVSSTDGSASANVVVTINGTDDSTNGDPEPEDDIIVVSLDTVAQIPAEWLLQNDGDPDMDTLTVTAIDDTGLPAGWSVTPVFSGTDIVSFELSTPGAVTADLVLNYEVSDGNGGTASNTVTIKLVSPSGSGDDIVDISTLDYHFSYIEGKDGDDATTGGSDGVGLTGAVGNDLFIGGVGDDDLIGGAGDDMLYGGNLDGSDAGFTNNLIGDAFATSDSAFASGDDQIFGGNNVSNNIYGDVQFVTLAGGTLETGNDVIVGGNDAPSNQVSGDVQSFSGGTLIGGDDHITGGNLTPGSFFGSNTLVGDVFSGSGDVVGGNDTLIGGDLSVGFFGGNNLVGDVNGGNWTNATGGDDRLVSGQNTDDTLTGDFNTFASISGLAIGGADTFVFGENNGTDTITDFEAGKDTVELTGFASLDEFVDLAGLWTTSTGGLTLDLDGAVDGFGDVIVFNGFTLGDEATLSGDFMFT